MTYKYCDWTSGNDLTGDGTAGNPYKTIEKAGLMLSGGGDEVRVAKAAAHTTLSGTLQFTDGNATIITSENLTGSLSANDMVGKNADDLCWWKVSSVTSNSIVLSTVYSGTSEVVTGYKMGFHDLGTAAANTTVIDRISKSGTSLTSRLKVSGGWNLGTELQDGETFFKQSGTNQYGFGLFVAANYVEIEKLHYARCYDGFNFNNTSSQVGCLTSNVGAYSCGRYGLVLAYAGTRMSFGGTIRISQSGSHSFHAAYNQPSQASFVESDAIIESRSCYGGPVLGGGNCYWKKFIVKRTTTWSSFHFINGDNVRVGELVIENGYGIWADNSPGVGIVIGKYTATGVTNAISTPISTITIYHYIPTAVSTDVIFHDNELYSGCPIVKIQRYGNNNYSARMYFRGLGIIYQDATNARTTRCIRFAPTYATFGMPCPVGSVKCMNTTLDMTFSVYMKKDVSFNGAVEMAAFILGKRVTGWTAKTLTTSYAEYTLVVSHDDMTLTEYVELQVRVNGTAGNVYVDDFSVSQ